MGTRAGQYGYANLSASKPTSTITLDETIPINKYMVEITTAGGTGGGNNIINGGAYLSDKTPTSFTLHIGTNGSSAGTPVGYQVIIFN